MKKFLRKTIAILTTITILTFAGAPSFAAEPASDSVLSQESLEFLLEHDVDVSVFEKGSPALDKHSDTPVLFDEDILSLMQEAEVYNFSSEQIQQYVKGLIDNPTTVVKDIPTTVIRNGKVLDFDVPPKIENGRALVPLRAIFESMGANVKWDEKTQTVTAKKDNTSVSIEIGSLTPSINGQIKKIDVPAKLVQGRTLAPLRFVGEAFGESVDWDSELRIIKIFTLESNDPWGIQLNTSNITPVGLTLICTQSAGQARGDLQTGSYYFLEEKIDDQWIPVEILPSEGERAWTDEAWVIPMKDTVKWDVNWEGLYGELSPGEYRMGKKIDDLKDTGDYDEKNYYANFEITK